MQGFKEVDPSFITQASSEGAHLIDVRTEAEVAQGVISGAVHIPLHLLPLRAGDVPQDKPVVIYCRSGARSAQACAFMEIAQSDGGKECFGVGMDENIVTASIKALMSSINRAEINMPGRIQMQAA